MLCGLLIAGPARTADAPEPARAQFDLFELRVLGNTVLPATQVESTVYPFLGPHKTLDDVQAARAALEQAYRDQGYGTVFVDIPEQSVEDGIVRLQVTEGRLARVGVTGLRYFSGRQIRAALPAATAGEVPRIPALQDQLASVNRVTPDRVVVPVLKAGSAPGTVNLSLKVEDHLPLHGSLELNNQYSPDTKPLRAIGVLRYDNLFGRQDSLSFQYQTSPQRTSDVRVYAGGYTRRLGDDGATLSFTGVHSSSSVATVGTLTVLGNATIYGLHYARPVTGPVAWQQQMNLGVDYKRVGQTVQLSRTQSLVTPISYPAFSASYSLALPAGPWFWTASMSGNFGIRGLATHNDEFANKCSGCQANYFYLRSEDAVRYTFKDGFNVGLRLGAQYSADALVSNEQYVIGGAASIRGYYEAEELGDTGLRGALELGTPTKQWEHPRLALGGLLFIDDGRVGFVQPLPGQPQGITLRSWGAGLNFSSGEALEASATWSRTLLSGGHTLKGESRVLFSVRGAW